MDRPVALVIDGDPSVRAALRGVLALRDYAVLEAPDGAELPHLLRDQHVVLLIVECPGDCAGVAPLWRQATADPRGPIVLALAHDGVPLLDLIRGGCFDVLPRPPEELQLHAAIERAMRQWDLLAETRRLRNELRLHSGPNTIVGRSAALDELRAQLPRLAGLRCGVCISGETGTGKELVARALHELGPAAAGEFVTLSCALLSETGWEAGPAPGLLARARGGTLYLEELPDLAPELQPRLLETLGPDLRVIVSSRGRPKDAVADGSVTAEAARLLARETLHIPPLRERREDVAPLARHFVATIREINRLPELTLAPEAVERLERYHWPANVEELRNAMEQAVILAREGVIRPLDLPDRVRDGAADVALGLAASGRSFRAAKREVVDAFEARYLRELMLHHHGNVTAASQQAGMLRSALQRLLRKHGLRSVEFRGGRPVDLPRDAPR